MRITRKLSVLALAVLAVQLVRCGDDTGGGESASHCEGALPTSVVYAGAASDEAIERVWDRRCDAEAIDGAATLVSPAEGEAVPATRAPTLRWEQALAAAPVRTQTRQGGTGPSFPTISFGVQPAWAHLPPVTGWVYLVELRPASGGESAWLFTDQLSWTPDAVMWGRLLGAGTLTVRITSAYLNQNVVDEGPWLGQERSFRIGEG